jgi:Flp pilus assembly pilin Flp
MIHLMWYLRDRLSYVRDQRGIETLEWILIGGIVAGVAAGTYALLQGGLDTAVTDITNFISGQVPSGGTT